MNNNKMPTIESSAPRNSLINRSAFQRNIPILCLSTVVSGVGTGIALLGIPWSIQSSTGDTSLVSAYFIGGYAVLIVLLPAASAIFDRYPRKKSASFIFAFGVAMQSVAAVWTYLDFSISVLIFSGAGSVVLRALDQVNRTALAQELVAPEKYRVFTRWLEICRQIITLLAGGVAALVLDTGGLVMVLTIDAATYLFSAVLLIPLKPQFIFTPNCSNSQTLISNVLGGWNQLRLNKSLFWHLVATVAPLTAVVAQNVIYPSHFRDFLRADASDYALHAVAYGFGAIIAAILTRYRQTSLHSSLSTLLNLVIYFFALLCVALIPSLLVTYIGIFMFAFCSATIRVNRTALLMHIIPQSYMARVNGMLEIFSTGLTILCAILSGALSHFGVPWIWSPFVVLLAASICLTIPNWKYSHSYK